MSVKRLSVIGSPILVSRLRSRASLSMWLSGFCPAVKFVFEITSCVVRIVSVVIFRQFEFNFLTAIFRCREFPVRPPHASSSVAPPVYR